MKKSLICGTLSLVLATIPAISAFADDSTHDVTVGEVDETIYSLDINWGDMIFDWKYNDKKNDFEFRAHWSCTGNMVWSSYGSISYYTDDTCTTQYTENIEGTSGLYRRDPHSNINVTDNSINGRLKTSVVFVPEDDYSWVIGKFTNQNETTLDRNNETITYGEEIEGGVLPKMITVQPKYYGATFHLEKDPSATITAESITASDKIGTITLLISPDTDPVNN